MTDERPADALDFEADDADVNAAEVDPGNTDDTDDGGEPDDEDEQELGGEG